ncbi:uncharacterized protein TrAFT101_001919 [Trichoderma asperellum]|uniref:uncharacterized protein n=1 Tax=Trichoderma asperellum TaxID=101201 RepID=UPI00331CF907|nr:hypothetical protein TrAFT101_001919 [Trichoderma asperellum]
MGGGKKKRKELVAAPTGPNRRLRWTRDARHRRKVPDLEGPGTTEWPTVQSWATTTALLPPWRGILRGAAATESSPSAYAWRMQGKSPPRIHIGRAASPEACTGAEMILDALLPLKAGPLPSRR